MRNVLTLPQAMPKAQKMAYRSDLIDLQLFLHVVEAGSITNGFRRPDGGAVQISRGAPLTPDHARGGHVLLELRKQLLVSQPSRHFGAFPARC